MLTIGIIGVGTVGQALFNVLSSDSTLEVLSYDKYNNKGNVNYLHDMITCDIIFLCLPTLYDASIKEYNKCAIEETLEYFSENNFKSEIVIRSTVEPKYTFEKQQKFHDLNIIFNPEFLRASKPEECIRNQDFILIGYPNSNNNNNNNSHSKLESFYKNKWPNALLFTGDSTEMELLKITSNSFFAVKVQFFNEIYLLSQKIGVDYKSMMDKMLTQPWISPWSTTIPGPDGKLSYGGMCLPKDSNALLEYMKRNDTFHKVLESCVEERNIMRDD